MDKPSIPVSSLSGLPWRLRVLVLLAAYKEARGDERRALRPVVEAELAKRERG